VLTEHLTAVGVLEDRAIMIGQVWQDGGKKVTEQLRECSVGCAKVLDNTNWSVHVNVASNATAMGREVLIAT